MKFEDVIITRTVRGEHPDLGHCTVYVIEAKDAVDRVLQFLYEKADETKVALDFETTALDPKTGEVRLSSFCFDRNTAVILDHKYCGSFKDLAADIGVAGPFYVFNGKFELHWFRGCGEDLTQVYDVAHMRRSVLGGGPLSLLTQAKRDLDVTLDKAEQLSDWSAEELTDEQLFYAGLDAIVTKRLGDKWADEMTPEHWNGFHVINDATQAVIEMENTGLLLDEEYHQTLITMWGKRRDTAERVIRKYANEDLLPNIRSKKQLSELFKTAFDAQAIAAWPKTETTEQLSTSRDTLRQVSFRAPYPMSRFLAALIVFNRADKYLSTYGETLLTKQYLGHGRIYGRLNMAQAVTGRFSSSNPNMQNIPHSALVRRSFITTPGNKLSIADYTGIEIRTLAELSGDEQLLYDCIHDDIHSRSAIAIFRQDADTFLKAIEAKEGWTKVMRRKSKAFTFQLLYGATAPALAIVLRCSRAEAEDAIAAWAKRYPKAYHYRQNIFEKMNHTGFIPVASGRTIYVRKPDRTMPVAANYGVQGSAGDVMYSACTAVHRKLVERDLPTRMMVTVHDELLLDGPEEFAEEASEVLEEGMTEGWLRIFPGTSTENLVEAVIGDTWADKP